MILYPLHADLPIRKDRLRERFQQGGVTPIPLLLRSSEISSVREKVEIQDLSPSLLF